MREENLGFQLILYYGDVMLTVELAMDSQEQLDRVGQAKKTAHIYLKLIFFIFFLSI